MEFKVGDRVWAIDPPINLEESDPQDKGPGRVLEVNPRPFDGAYLVKLDSGKEWAYWESSLKHLLATPTPSITVGTQVRLTGVVRQVQPNGAIGVDVYVGCQDGLHWFKPAEVEVIRQPFKRGEVVYFEDHGIACVVLEDEQNGRMLLIEASEGKYATYVDAANYQRRP